MSKPTSSSADLVLESDTEIEELVGDLWLRVSSTRNVESAPDSTTAPLALSDFEIVILEAVLLDWLDSRPLLKELDERRRVESEAGKLAQAGKLRDAARKMGWVAPKGRRAAIYDCDDVVRSYLLLTTRNTLKVRQYLQRDHGLTAARAEEMIPEAPFHPMSALELLAEFHGFPSPEAMRKFLQRAKRSIESQRAELEAAGDPRALDLPEIRIPSDSKPE